MLTLLINHNYISDVTSFVTSNKSFGIQEIQLLHTNQFKEMECKLGIYTLSDGEELGSFTGILQQGDLYFDVYKGKRVNLILSGIDIEKELLALETYNIDSITLNRSFCENRIYSLEFLKEYPSIKKVHICNDDFVLDGLYYLNDLEELQLSGKKPIDYLKFNRLKVLSVQHPGPYVFPDSIQTLHIWHMKLKGNTLGSIRFPKSLQELYLYWTDIQSLEGLPSNLKTFGIFMSRNLRSLKGLSASSDTLQKLWIENCPHLEAYEDLGTCTKMRHMLILECRHIPNLSFLPNMKELNHFAFYGTQVDDCNLENLKGIPSVYFKNHKGYNYKLKDFRED